MLSGQDILTVPSIAAKLQAQLRGLGCGHLPRWMAAPYFASGALIEKQTIEAKPTDKTQIAWRTPVVGKSLKWFITQLSEPAIQHTLLGSPAPRHHESISHV